MLRFCTTGAGRRVARSAAARNSFSPFVHSNVFSPNAPRNKVLRACRFFVRRPKTKYDAPFPRDFFSVCVWADFCGGDVSVRQMCYARTVAVSSSDAKKKDSCILIFSENAYYILGSIMKTCIVFPLDRFVEVFSSGNIQVVLRHVCSRTCMRTSLVFVFASCGNKKLRPLYTVQFV